MKKPKRHPMQVLKAKLLLDKGFITEKSALPMSWREPAKKGINLFTDEILIAASKRDMNYFSNLMVKVAEILKDKKITDLN